MFWLLFNTKNYQRIFLIAFMIIPCLGLAQVTTQFGMGVLVTSEQPKTSFRFKTSSAQGTFSYSSSYVSRFALLNSYAINDKWAVRTGLEGSPAHFIGKVIDSINNPGQGISLHAYARDFKYVNIYIPMDVQYTLTPWLYVYGGLAGSFSFDLTSRENDICDSSSGVLSSNCIELRRRQVEYSAIFDNKIKRLNLSYRLGLLMRYRRVGLEYGYDHLLTNILSDGTATYQGESQPAILKYGNFHFKVLYFFNAFKFMDERPSQALN